MNLKTCPSETHCSSRRSARVNVHLTVDAIVYDGTDELKETQDMPLRRPKSEKRIWRPSVPVVTSCCSESPRIDDAGSGGVVSACVEQATDEDLASRPHLVFRDSVLCRCGLGCILSLHTRSTSF